MGRPIETMSKRTDRNAGTISAGRKISYMRNLRQSVTLNRPIRQEENSLPTHHATSASKTIPLIATHCVIRGAESMRGSREAEGSPAFPSCRKRPSVGAAVLRRCEVYSVSYGVGSSWVVRFYAGTAMYIP